MSVIYVRRELRRHRRQAITVVFGIGIGLGLGLGLGLTGSWLVGVFFPSFDAGSGLISNTFGLPLHASVSLTVAALAIGLAVLGGLVAGSFGGWRTAQLQPAEALRRMR